MNSMQKVGGYAALISGVQYIAMLVFVFGLLMPPGLHVDTDTMVEADKRVMVVMTNHPTPFLIQSMVNGLFSITLLLCTLALRERLQAGAPNRMRIGVIAASVASALFLVSVTISFIGILDIVVSKDFSVFRMLNVVTQGLEYAAVFAYGWTTLLCGWAGLSTKVLPSGLSYVLLLSGVFSILGIVIFILQPLEPVINMVWAFWLGYVLLSRDGASKLAT